MAGHSKWANIKHRKARQDAKRAKVWTKVIRELTVAARLGGYDPEVISGLYTRCTEHCGPPKVNRIAKVQVVAKIFKITSQWNASCMLEFMGSRWTISPPTHIKSWPIDCTEEIDSY